MLRHLYRHRADAEDQNQPADADPVDFGDRLAHRRGGAAQDRVLHLIAGRRTALLQELQSLLEMHAPESKVLAASFKTPRQALDCLLAGCEAITLPLDVAQQMLGTPAVESAIEKFEQDWNNAFGTLNL